MFTGRIAVQSSHTYQSPTTESSQSTNATSSINHSEDYTLGTGANQAGFAFSRTENSAAAVTYDLNGGTLFDQVGRAIALTKLNSVIIRNTHATATLDVEDGAANAINLFGVAGDKVTVSPGGVLVLTWPTVAKAVDATHKNFKVTPSALATWQVQVVGS
jgi:hypothetical protein